MDDLPNSRTWCPGNPDCDDPKMLCQDLVDDYQAFQVIIYVCYISKTFFCRCSQRSSRADTCKLFSPCSLIKILMYIIHLYRVYRYEDFSMDPANNTLEVEEQQKKSFIQKSIKSKNFRSSNSLAFLCITGLFNSWTATQNQTKVCVTKK